MSISIEILRERRQVAEQKLAGMRAAADDACRKAAESFAPGRRNAWAAVDAKLSAEADAYAQAIKDIFDPLMLVAE